CRWWENSIPLADPERGLSKALCPVWQPFDSHDRIPPTCLRVHASSVESHSNVLPIPPLRVADQGQRLRICAMPAVLRTVLARSRARSFCVALAADFAVARSLPRQRPQHSLGSRLVPRSSPLHPLVHRRKKCNGFPLY